MIDNILATVLLIPSIVVTLMFFIYGYNCLYLIKAMRRYRTPKPCGTRCERPLVAIHLPIYNEKYVVQRLLESCARMAENYGQELVRIMILDDSSDETTKEVKDIARFYSSQGFKIEVLHREKRRGFKAGALQEALQKTGEEYIAIFDSDFLPPPDFLNRTVPHLVANENLGIVQCRWSYINREYNSITKAVAIGMNAHFLIEQPGRYASQCFLNFNGSGGLIRSKALREAGGWQSDTLAEDLDASYRIQMKGYQVLYIRNILTPCEITPTITSFKRQQGRWACGSLQTAKKTLPKLLREKTLGRRQKIEAFVHLTYYLVHPLIFTSFLLAVTAGILGIDTIGFKASLNMEPGQSMSDAILQTAQMGGCLVVSQPLLIPAVVTILTCWATVWIFYIVTLRLEGSSLTKNFPSLLILGLIGFGISISNTLQSAGALLSNKTWSFERTPKYALKRRFGEWRNKKYQVPLNKTFYLELMAIALGFVAIMKALQDTNIGLVPILFFYIISYGFVGMLTFVHSGREG